jgi:D-amino-acid oxidase
MPAITIIGAGVFGLSIAHALPLSYDITVLARDMPGDDDSLEWASPW